MNLKILNKEYNIVSIGREDFPMNLHKSTTMFYLPQRDVIVLNDDSPVLNDLEGLISEYLSLNDIQRKMCMEEVVKHNQKVILSRLVDTFSSRIFPYTASFSES